MIHGVRPPKESDATARAHLAEVMDERRVRLGLTWNELAAKAGLTKEGLRSVRTETRKIMPLTRRGIEAALKWAPGSIDRVLANDQPIETASVTATAYALGTTYASAAAHRAGDTATVAVVEDVPRLPNWFVSEVQRRGRDLGEVLAGLDVLKGIAGHFDYSLSELLVEAGLADAGELVIRDRAAPPHTDILEAVAAEAEKILADPHLSRSQRKEAKERVDQLLKELEEKVRGNA